MNKWTCTRQGELYHHGIKGQKWGIRRFQNKDGSLTPAGEKRYGDGNPNNQTPKQETKKSNSIDGTKVYSKHGSIELLWKSPVYHQTLDIFMKVWDLNLKG